MAGTAHITHGLTRWDGKPTSGRFVYQSRQRPGRWFWQCDLCGEPEYADDAPLWPTMQGAFAEAERHAAVCTGEYTEPTEGEQRFGL